MSHAAALAGLDIALFPEFACVDDLRRKRLVPVLGACVVDVSAICPLYSARRFIPARLRAFVNLARERFARLTRWLPGGGGGRCDPRRPRRAGRR